MTSLAGMLVWRDNVKNRHEILRYLFQILTTPLTVAVVVSRKL